MSNFILLAIIVILVFLFVATSKAKHKLSAAKFFKLTILSTIAWVLTILLTETDQNPSDVIFWSRMSFVFPILIILSLYPFIYHFLDSSLQKKIYLPRTRIAIKILNVLGVVMIGVSLSDLIVKDVVNLKTTFGIMQLPYLGYLLSCFAILIIIQHRSRVSSKSALKQGLEYISAGITLSIFLGILSNLIFPIILGLEYRFLGPFSVIFFIGFTYYAIIAKQLFDIRVIISKTIIYSIIIVAIFSIYAVLIIVMAWITQGTLSFSLDPKMIVSSMLGTIIVGLSYQPIALFLAEKTDIYLFKKRYDPDEEVKDLTHKLSTLINLDEAIKIISGHLKNTLKVNHVISYVLHNSDKPEAAVSAIHTFGNVRSTATLGLSNPLVVIKHFNKCRDIISVKDLEDQLEEEHQEFERNNPKSAKPLPDPAAHTNLSITHSTLARLKAEVVVPIYIHGVLIAIINLGQKLSGDSFNKDDFDFLQDVRTASVSSIDLAKLYESDQMKSEFISIASHELITPISAMQGYLAMILDEKIGKADKQATGYLVKSRESAQRLAQLVKDILTVSRLENGKISFDASSVNLLSAVKEAIQIQQAVADENEVKIIDETPSTPEEIEKFPTAWANYDRIKDIASNLLGNAVRYTKNGSATIKFEYDKKNKQITTSIIDTGVGIKTEDKIHIFQKFFRANDINSARVVGTGLGLFITKNMIEKMGGTVGFHSKEGEGSTFYFTIPTNAPKSVKEDLD